MARYSILVKYEIFHSNFTKMPTNFINLFQSSACKNNQIKLPHAIQISTSNPKNQQHGSRRHYSRLFAIKNSGALMKLSRQLLKSQGSVLNLVNLQKKLQMGPNWKYLPWFSRLYYLRPFPWIMIGLWCNTSMRIKSKVDFTHCTVGLEVFTKGQNNIDVVPVVHIGNYEYISRLNSARL